MYTVNVIYVSTQGILIFLIWVFFIDESGGKYPTIIKCFFTTQAY